MREIIVLYDDEPSPSSQTQHGLTEAQKSRMVQQKQLAMARLQARKLQQSRLPFCTSDSKSPELGNRHWIQEAEAVSNTSRTGLKSEEWQQSEVPSHGFDKWDFDAKLTSQYFNSNRPNPAGRPWVDRVEGQSRTASDGWREEWQRSEHPDHGYSVPISTSQSPDDPQNARQPIPGASGERDEEIERGYASNKAAQRRKSRVLDLSTEGEEGQSGRVQRRKSGGSADVTTHPSLSTITKYFQRAGEIRSTHNAVESMDCEMQDRRAPNMRGATTDGTVCLETPNTNGIFSSSSLLNGDKRHDSTGSQEDRGISSKVGISWGAYSGQHGPGKAEMNVGYADIEFYNGNQCKETPRQVTGEVVGEWRSVRKTPAAGSSFGRQITVPSSQYNHSSGSDPWEATQRWRAQSNAKIRAHVSSSSNTAPGCGKPISGISYEPEFQEPVKQWTAYPRANASHPPLDRARGAENSKTSVPGVPEVAKPAPSKQQMQVLKAIAEGRSVFVTGSAGTGKSFILEDALQTLRGMYGEDAVFVTASTGLAACVLGGTTVHSFAGIGVDNDTKEQLANKVNKKKQVKARWQKAQALIIDEISMIDGELFDNLEYVARTVKKGKGPEKIWGGLQLVVTGDFFQLPPVKPRNALKYFAFQADCWQKCFDLQVELTHVFRQSDTEFVRMLNEIRCGICSPSTLQRLRQCHGPSDSAITGIEMTRLYPRTMDVSHENNQNLRALGKEFIVYRAKDDAQNEFARRQLDNLRAVATQPLCVGAQVMLIKNLEMSVGLVNGARGVVVRFSAPDDGSVAEYQKLAKHINPTNQWPIVRFACDGIERLVGPESWSVFDGNKEVAKRTQIPLMLAWALSVHKCQGMTLDRVETNLSKAFDHGMVYVALSRVKSLEGLHLIDFDPSRIKTHPLVSKFYQGLNKEPIVDLEEDNFE